MLKDKIVEAMESDGDYTNKEESRIKKLYETASPDAKEIIDNIFINLTGYSLRTFINPRSDD
jgi:hypothetical protein